MDKTTHKCQTFLPIIIVDLQQRISKSNDLILAKLVFIDCETYRYSRDPKHIRGLGYGEQRQKMVLQDLNSCPWQYHSVWSPHLQCNHYTPVTASQLFMKSSGETRTYFLMDWHQLWTFCQEWRYHTHDHHTGPQYGNLRDCPSPVPWESQRSEKMTQWRLHNGKLHIWFSLR